MLKSPWLAKAELVVDADIRKHSRLSNVQDWRRRTWILGSLRTRVCGFPLTVDAAVAVVVFLLLHFVFCLPIYLALDPS